LEELRLAIIALSYSSLQSLSCSTILKAKTLWLLTTFVGGNRMPATFIQALSMFPNELQSTMVRLSSCFGLILLLQAVASDDDCSSWPSELKSIRECCLTPKKYESNTEFSCEKTCLSKLEDKDIFKQSNSEGAKVFKTCMEECYLMKTTSPEGKIDKKSLRNVYLHTGSYMVSDEWRQVINAAGDKCELGSTDSLSENLAVYFICMENYFADNCIEFEKSESCRKVKAYAMKCKGFKQTCTKAPANVIGCCDNPYFYTDESELKCWNICQNSGYFVSLQVNCFYKCLQNETNLYPEGSKFDFEAVKKLLIENSNKTVDWSQEIEDSAKTCAVKGNFLQLWLVDVPYVDGRFLI
jgi:hypothetical protein